MGDIETIWELQILTAIALAARSYALLLHYISKNCLTKINMHPQNSEVVGSIQKICYSSMHLVI